MPPHSRPRPNVRRGRNECLPRFSQIGMNLTENIGFQSKLLLTTSICVFQEPSNRLPVILHSFACSTASCCSSRKKKNLFRPTYIWHFPNNLMPIKWLNGSLQRFINIRLPYPQKYQKKSKNRKISKNYFSF